MKFSGVAGKIGFAAAPFPLVGSGLLLDLLVGTAGSPSISRFGSLTHPDEFLTKSCLNNEISMNFAKLDQKETKWLPNVYFGGKI